ncbi:bacteriohemerythrin [Magnetovibrio sp.]|uniref:bacteriohemerythrin n=1 Tax=Magnetovibrio sp. TaxID=2024836 RepID=UPI002F9208AA
MTSKELEWSDKFSTDVSSIDRQHQELLYLSQKLLEVLSSDTAPLAEKQAVFQDLVEHALEHFAYEERIMQNICYPNLSHHKREHDELRKEIAQISESVMNGEGIEDWKGLVSLVQVWLLRHIVASDTPIREHIHREDDETL